MTRPSMPDRCRVRDAGTGTRRPCDPTLGPLAGDGTVWVRATDAASRVLVVPSRLYLFLLVPCSFCTSCYTLRYGSSAVCARGGGGQEGRPRQVKGGVSFSCFTGIFDTKDVRMNRVKSSARTTGPPAACRALLTSPPPRAPRDGSRLRALDSLGHLHHRVAVGWPRVIPALRPFARSRLHGGAAAWRKAALPRRDDFLAAHRAEVIHGIAEQRVLVAIETVQGEAQTRE